MTSDPFVLLDLRVATLAQVKAAYREAARSLHPDAGGDPEEFQKLLENYTRAADQVTGRVCATCHGTGTVVHTAGFSSIKLPCPICH